ncbi:MAG: DNA polymerase III subunit gamma/tau [Oscillospiraceae bacterium]|nr:DNA polymerase III subunit gamma/tau [Oscillospiraceae bacterium]
MHQALYRIWRPGIFDDVVGQEHITTTLKNEIAAGRPAHAYLFIGSRGTGKATCARIVAKAVNCLNQHDGNPCGECEMCRGIDNGSLVDVVEIDAASNNGVENIRDLREEANFLPNAAKYRVYIIDEVHMLSVSAFNALLKILEEPPAHVLFVLATTEVHKVPATILSRCQRFDFRRIDSGVIAGRLQQVAQGEGFHLEEEAAMLIARMADGGMRDALSIMDLCSSYNREITVDTVSQATGLVAQDYLFKLAEAAHTRNTGEFLELVGQAGRSYVEYDRLCEQLIGHYRNLMVAKSSKKPEDLIVCLPEVLEQYKEQARRFPVAEILQTLTILQETLAAMTKTTYRRTELEMAAVRICELRSQAPVGESADTSALEGRLASLEQRFAAGAVPAAAQPKAAQEEPKTAAAAPAKQEPAAPKGAAPAADLPISPFAEWPQVLTALSKTNVALSGFLVSSRAFFQGNRVLIDCRNSMFLDLVRNNQKAKDDLKRAIAQVTGQNYGIGPYNAETAPEQPDQQPTNPVDALLSNAKAAGIPIEIN